MNYMIKDPTESLARSLAGRINSDGYAVIENYVAPEQLHVAQGFVADAIAANGGEYVHFSGTEHLDETFLAALPDDPDFVALCRGIYTSETGRPAPATGFHQILRCLSARVRGSIRCASISTRMS